MKLSVCTLSTIFFIAASTSALAENFGVYDKDGNYSYGKVREGGRIEVYDQNGNYSYGKIKEGGKIELYDQNGNYTYGRTR